MNAMEATINPSFPSTMVPETYDWSYPSSSASASSSSETGSVDLLDLWFDSTPHESPALLANFAAAAATASSASSYLGVSGPLPPTLGQRLVSSISSASTTSTNTSCPSSSTSPPPPPRTLELSHPDSGLQGFCTRGTLMETIQVDRKIRRREQNRKAQSNFRQKRKEEVRRLESEVEGLRMQIAGLHKSAPVAGLTICTRCRNFYPASLQTALPPALASECDRVALERCSSEG